MSLEQPAVGRLDYSTCTYGTSKLRFRGPKKHLRPDCIPVIGGTETFGRYVAASYPDMVGDLLDRQVVNFGIMHAGLDVFLKDETVLNICRSSPVSVIQVPAAVNLTNRFFTVHPRRNDRFVTTTALMKAIYPEVDFTEFHFTRHMLSALEDVSPDRFALIRDELRKTWVARMNLLTARMKCRVVLIWMGERGPDEPGEWIDEGEPALVTRAMLAGLTGRIENVVEFVRPQPPDGPPEGMVVPEGEEQAALRLPGPEMHAQAARALARAIRGVLG